jgi:hypothetical protein
VLVHSDQLNIPAPPQTGHQYLFSGGGVTITWDPNDPVDPVGNLQKCLAEGGPTLSLDDGKC